MSRKVQPKAQTIAELEAEVNAAEQAVLQEGSASDALVEPKTQEVAKSVEEPAPAKSEEAKTVEQTPAPMDVAKEIEAMKSAMAEKDSRIAELTKRVRDEDGRNGGKLSDLQASIARLGDQLRDVMTENRELRQRLETPKVVEAPPEPDTLEAEYPDVAKGIDRRTKPAYEAATRAEREAREAREEIAKLREAQRVREYNSFLDEVRRGVPDMDRINGDPMFIEWCKSNNPASPMSRQQVLDACASSMNAKPVVELFQQWKNEQNKSSDTPAPVKAGPAKPTKEAQLTVPQASASSSAQKAKPDAASRDRRIAELEKKVYAGRGTKEDLDEVNRLLDEKEREAST